MPQVGLREGTPQDLKTELEDNTSSAVYVPKFQRAMASLRAFARSLFDQFYMVDGRGDLIESRSHGLGDYDKQDSSAEGGEQLAKHMHSHALSRQQFLNLCVYLGILEPPLSVVDATSDLSALSNLGDRVRAAP